MLFPLRPNIFSCSILACCDFLFCDSNLSSDLGFDFLPVVVRGAPIFSLINFTPAYIKSFNFVILFIGIFVNRSFTLSVSDFTDLQSWFLREGNVVFLSNKSLFMISTFIISFLGQCLCRWVCGVSAFINYRLDLIKSFWFCCIQCLGYCIWVFVYVFSYIFLGGFPVFQGQKTSHSLLLS